MVDATTLGQSHRAVMLQTAAKSACIIMGNCHIKAHEMTATLDVSHGLAHHTTYKMAQFHMVFARWASTQLTSELKESCVKVC
jgi:putative AlgH/UPF0301 family transcriptional regulator